MNMQRIGALWLVRAAVISAAVMAPAAACSRAPNAKNFAGTSTSTPSTAPTYTVRDTSVDALFDAVGVAAPVRQATLSTKLMASVTEVLVHEGDRVVAGQLLVRVDARDLSAKAAQVAASVAEAKAVHRDALTQANRIRALYADSAAARAQLDAAETGLARAEAGLRAARAAAAELGAVSSYSEVHAPFAGIVTKRFVDPGAFATPGTPLVAIQDVSALRITASATPEIAHQIHRGQVLSATIENHPVQATVEGVVPAQAGNMYEINALVSNTGATFLAGSAATLSLPTGMRTLLVVPAAAIVREGDLTGVTLRTAHGDERRWIRLGRPSAGFVEVSAGLRAGDRVVLPSGAATSTGN
jgi:RND family efflux transporter MFP subunit